jgi:hypothetical protein
MSISTNLERLGQEVRARRERAMDALLRRMDLQPRQSALRPLLWFAAGALAVGGLVYILAPESGRKARERIVKLARERVPMHRERVEKPAPPVEQPSMAH